MAVRTWLMALLLLILNFCHSGPVQDKSAQLAKSYAACIAKYDLLIEELRGTAKNSGQDHDADKANIVYNRIMSEKKMELEKLLHANEKNAPSDQLDLLRSKIMVEIKSFEEAEIIIDRLSLGNSKVAVEAKLQKVTMRLLQHRNIEALSLFKEIEPQLKKDAQFYQLYLALASSSSEPAIREEYSLKFANSSELPVAMQPFRSRVYLSLADLAKDDFQLEKAKSYLEKALILNGIPSLEANIQEELKHIELLNQPARPLQADFWFNTAPLTLAGLKGQVVVIFFWAPWCKPCREMIPAILDEFRQSKDQGLQIIGYTKLYGSFNDNSDKKEKISAAEELVLLKKYLDNNKITYPVAVGAEGFSFDTYAISIIPTMVFINRLGNIAYIKSGTGNDRLIREKIKSLLEKK